MSRILIVEDEKPMRTALTDALSAEDYRVLTAANGQEGLDKTIAEKPDLILLDVMMPKLDGFAVCAELRRLNILTPVLMLTAKGQIDDRVNGLDAGADDYLVKPFSMDELLARIRALLRRTTKIDQTVEQLVFGKLKIDLIRQSVSGSGDQHFTAKEFAMLRLLAEADGEPVSRERFLDVVWGYVSYPTTRTVDNHIASLRSKIEPEPAKPVFLKTAHGIGYRLERKRNAGQRK